MPFDPAAVRGKVGCQKLPEIGPALSAPGGLPTGAQAALPDKGLGD
jgi:hypothetical protein